MFHLHTVFDSDLPDDHDWVLVEHDGKAEVFVKESADGMALLTEVAAAVGLLRTTVRV
jgi:hypothetical protein